jgi:hypothetical protein
MSILTNELKLYGSASMPDDDSATAIGGAISTAKKIDFTDVNGNVQAVSSATADTTQTVTVSYRDAAGNLLTEVNTLTGRTPVAYAATMERLLKAVKSATCSGDVAVEDQTPARTGTAQAGDANTITLDAGASAADSFYNGMVVRLNGGTGQFQIREILAYDGTSKLATVSSAWGTNPDNTSTFIVSKGFYFDKGPVEITQIRRPFFNASANIAGGATKTYYEKVFFKNTNGSLALTSSVIQEALDPGADIAFGLSATATLDDTDTNGGGNNRQVAPAGVTFNSADKNVRNSQSLTAGAAQGFWLELTLLGGAAAQKTTYQPRLTGNTT